MPNTAFSFLCVLFFIFFIPELFNFHTITDFVKQNIDTFMSLLESVWSIIKGNISLIMSSFSAFLSILLGGGTAVLNFILNVVGVLILNLCTCGIFVPTLFSDCFPHNLVLFAQLQRELVQTS